MVNKCSAPDCKSGHKGNDFKGTLFSFPTHEPLLSEWIEAAPRNVLVTKNSRLCSLHFSAEDFVVDRSDSNTTRCLSRGELSRKRLKPTAVPRIWPNCPVHLCKQVPKPRGKAATSQSRTLVQIIKLH